MTFHIVGGLYREYCVRPEWDFVFGSGGRATAALGVMGEVVTLHTYASPATVKEFKTVSSWLGKITVEENSCYATVSFSWLHDSGRPRIRNIPWKPYPPIKVSESKVIRFGMLENSPVVHADWAVYDPQNEGAPARFGDNGSTANHLALILNLRDARRLCGDPEAKPEICASKLAVSDNAEVVVIKLGAAGFFVWSRNASGMIPAYKTKSVWKIGSGDIFVAHFARAWLGGGMDPIRAAGDASKAVAYYSETRTMPATAQLASFNANKVEFSQAYLNGDVPSVYLMGPSFNTAQAWLVEEARANLTDLGMKVTSPFYEARSGVVLDSLELEVDAIVAVDLIFAIVDGVDKETMYQIGYAQAQGKKVVVFCEHGDALLNKMQQASKCVTCDNYSTALYSALWAAVSP